jgi:hypothetical protein
MRQVWNECIKRGSNHVIEIDTLESSGPNFQQRNLSMCKRPATKRKKDKKTAATHESSYHCAAQMNFDKKDTTRNEMMMWRWRERNRVDVECRFVRTISILSCCTRAQVDKTYQVVVYRGESSVRNCI